MTDKRVVISDLDGTLLDSQSRISTQNRACLEALGKKGILRVLATGRSLWSLRRVIKPEDPIDYVIFSTGAGMMDWRTQKLIYSKNLASSEIQGVYEFLEGIGVDYMLQEKVPQTHYIHYRRRQGLADFEERLSFYRDFARPLSEEMILACAEATQFLAVLGEEQRDVYFGIKASLKPLNVILATSPLDKASLWIEIFASDVNKGESFIKLLEILGHEKEQCMVIGNDFNDIDMLEKVEQAYVTANAPEALLKRYKNVADNDSDGFSMAVQDWLSK